ncbi:MAG: YqjK-like family protein [Gammaproteobacteria bacterium]|nr:YqjK-like family protein [Gammaproteobacteria bacterium]MBU1775881.1 YqjK-like family protein [Gammaproteobacteria bacterium]MBU1969000.1 YqjK-like family protein [Gammaproteobacteria bacterium]
MNRQMAVLMQRRGELQARIAAQRGELADIAARWEGPMAIADQGVAVVRFLRRQPLLVAGVTALFVIRRRGMMGLVRLGWLGWKGYRFVAGVAARLTPRP